MNTTRVKEMVFGYNSVDYIGDYINSFVSVFGVSLLDWKKLSVYSDGYNEEEHIAIMVTFDYHDALGCMNPNSVLDFITSAEYVNDDTWRSEGISMQTAKALFGNGCKSKDGKIYVTRRN